MHTRVKCPWFERRRRPPCPLTDSTRTCVTVRAPNCAIRRDTFDFEWHTYTQHTGVRNATRGKVEIRVPFSDRKARESTHKKEEQTKIQALRQKCNMFELVHSNPVARLPCLAESPKKPKTIVCAASCNVPRTERTDTTNNLCIDLNRV